MNKSFTGKSFKDYMKTIENKKETLNSSFGTVENKKQTENENTELKAEDIIKEHLIKEGFQIDSIIIEDKNITLEFESIKKDHDVSLESAFKKLGLTAENAERKEFTYKATVKKI